MKLMKYSQTHRKELAMTSMVSPELMVRDLAVSLTWVASLILMIYLMPLWAVRDLVASQALVLEAADHVTLAR